MTWRDTVDAIANAIRVDDEAEARRLLDAHQASGRSRRAMVDDVLLKVANLERDAAALAVKRAGEILS